MTDKKRIKKFLDYSFMGIIAVFIISLIFVPLHYFSLYGRWLISIFAILFVLSIILDLFYFAKETPHRKWGKPKKEDTRRIFGIKRKILLRTLEWVGYLALFLIIIGFKKGSIGSAECPDIIQGNANANFKIKYFYSPFCPYCWKQEPILTDVLKTYGDSFSLERYDIRYCKDEVARYKVSGTPSFVFILRNESKEFPSYGFIPKDKFEAIVKEQTSTDTELDI